MMFKVNNIVKFVRWEKMNCERPFGAESTHNEDDYIGKHGKIIEIIDPEYPTFLVRFDDGVEGVFSDDDIEMVNI